MTDRLTIRSLPPLLHELPPHSEAHPGLTTAISRYRPLFWLSGRRDGHLRSRVPRCDDSGTALHKKKGYSFYALLFLIFFSVDFPRAEFFFHCEGKDPLREGEEVIPPG